MAARLTANSLRDLIERSGLIKADQLEQLFDQIESEGLDLENPKAIAKALVEKGELTSWQTDFLLKGKHKGFFIGPYRLLRLLGKGGMGAVYLAEHQMMKRRCAVKVLPSRHVGENSSVLERFYVEAQAVAALDDPNIVRAYDVNKEMQGKTEIHYLVMEYIEGSDLQNFVNTKRTGLDYVEAVDFTRQAANGLAHAHQSGLIHRDIKPANLLLDSKGVVKILDLGLARFFDDGEQASLTKDYNDSTLGTADYLSPEQALNSHEVDTRTDIYSLGCTLYFMLTGQPLFPEGTVAQRLLAHQVKSPAPISKFRKDVPDDLLAMVDQMIAKKADDRFQSAAEVAEAAAIWLAEHANDEWKEQHPEVVGMGAEAVRREPTRAIKSAAEDTEMELGFAEDEPAAKPSPPQGSAPQPSPAAANDKTDSPATVPSKDLDSLPDLGDALNELDVASLEAMPAETDILADLPSGESSIGGATPDPLALQPGTAPNSPPSGDLGTQSGVISGSSSNVLTRSAAMQLASTAQAAPAANTAAQSDDEGKSPWKILLPILIGVGVLVPVVLIILMVAGGSEDEPTSTASNNADSGASPEATGKTDSQRNGGGQKTEAGLPTTDPDKKTSTDSDKKTGQKTQKPPKEVRPKNNPPEPDRGTVAVVDPPKPDDRPKKTDQEPDTPPKDKPPKNSPPVENDPPAEDPAEKALQMFAGIKEVSLKLDSVVPPQHLVYVTIVRMAGDATEAAGLNARSDDKGDALLHVSLTAENDEGFALLKLTAEFRCPGESKKDAVIVWKQEKEIGKLAPQLLKQQVKTSQILSIRKEIEAFFEQFKLDYQAAVAANAGQ